MNNSKDLSEMERFFLALADKTRLRLLNLMREGEVPVNFFVEVLGEGQPKISRHLAYLRSAGIVETRRDGKWIHYKIVKPENDFAAQVLLDTLVWLASNEQMRREYENLTAVHASSNDLITISPAPLDTFVETNVRINKSRELEIYLL